MPIIPITVSGQLDVSGQLNISGQINVSGVLNLLMGDNSGIAAWSPASLGAALIGWYKADAGVYVDAGSTLATNGQSVQQWNDQSGTGNHLSQATSGNRPVYTTGLLNSLPGIVFNAANTQWIANQAISLGGTTASVFIVAKGSTPSAGARFVSYTSTGDGNDFGATIDAVILFASSSTHVDAYRNNISLSGGTFVDNTFTQLGSIYDGVNNTVYISGTGQTSVANSDTFGATGALGIGAYVITPPGASGSGGVASPINGTFCEIIFTNTALSGPDRTLLAAYLTAKWGV